MLSRCEVIFSASLVELRIIRMTQVVISCHNTPIIDEKLTTPLILRMENIAVASNSVQVEPASDPNVAYNCEMYQKLNKDTEI